MNDQIKAIQKELADLSEQGKIIMDELKRVETEFIKKQGVLEYLQSLEDSETENN